MTIVQTSVSRRFLRRSLALALLLFCMPPLLHAAEDKLVVRQRVVDWKGSGFLYGPPYLVGYQSVKPVRSGSQYLGKFQPQAELAPHEVLLGRVQRPFLVNGGASDSDFVAVVALSWYPQFDNMDAVPGTLLVTLDDQEPKEIPLAFVRGHTFFTHTGQGTSFSLPIALVIDIPDGEHEIAVRVSSLPAGYLLLVGGEIDPEAPVAPPGEAVTPPPGHGQTDSNDSGG